MKNKKSKHAKLENKKVLFLEIGLVVVLGLVLLAFEWGTPELKKNQLGDINMENLIDEDILNTFQEEPPPPEEIPKPEKEKVVEVLTVVPDDKKETEVEINTEIDENTKVVIDMTQFEDKEEETEPIPFSGVEQQPEFPGGDVALLTFLKENLTYPEVPKENNIDGTVGIKFVINKNGEVTDVSIHRSIDPYLDKEAKRVISQMPAWKPGKQRGKPVPVTYILPVKFKLY
ncbi:MAG: energy transducer TonB [Bacteroidota bacterium]|nr:energy transducer TonB [Bacteroidota bacterium]